MTVTGSTPLWTACRTLLAEHVDTFFSEWGKTAETFEEDDVHDFRVSSRRLREALALFSPCLAPKRAKRVTKQVKKVTRMLGEMRNTDEAFRFFSGLAPEERRRCEKEIEDLLAALRREREEAHARLRDDLGRLAPAPLKQELQILLDRPDLFATSTVDSFMAFAFFAAGAIMERGEPVSEHLPAAVQEPNGAEQHQLRIAVKKLRYRLEIMEPLVREGYDELRGALKEYQDALGKLHDVDVFGDLVRERVEESVGKKALLQVIAQRRKRLYKSFMDLLKQDPIDGMASRIKGAL